MQNLLDVLMQDVSLKQISKHNGGEYAGPCPFCNGGTDRFRVWPVHPVTGKGKYWCRRCGQSGDVIDYVMDRRNFTYPEALEYLGIPLDEKPSDVLKPEQTEPEDTGPAWWQHLAKAIIDRSEQHNDRYDLWAAYKPLQPATVAAYSLGVGRLPASKQGRWHPFYKLIVPVFDDAGTVVQIRGRAFQQGDDSHWITSGKGKNLYNLSAVTSAPLIICENMIDCLLMMQQHPRCVAVSATTGVQSWADSWSQRIAEAGPSHVLIIFDNDSAGKRATPKVLQSLQAAGVNAQPYKWPHNAPNGADLGWLIQQGRGRSVWDALTHKQSPTDQQILTLLQQYKQIQ